MSGRNLSITQSGSMISVAVNVPANNGTAATVWSLISTALAALAAGAVTDPMKVVGFRFKGKVAAGTDAAAFLYGGENVAADGTNANGYCAAGETDSPPVSDPRNCFVIAPSGVNSVVPRIIEVFFSRGE